MQKIFINFFCNLNLLDDWYWVNIVLSFKINSLKRRDMGEITIQSKKTFLRISLVLFVFIGLYFSIFSSNHKYLGISADFINGEWIVKNIQSDGGASSSKLSIGDFIVEIDGKDSKENFLLNKWLIVEQATSITVLHQGERKNIIFTKSGEHNYGFIISSLLSLALFVFSYIYFKRHEISKISQYYYIFLLFTSIMFLAITPSSMGNVLARFVLVSYIVLFPFFIDVFWRASYLEQSSIKLSSFSKMVISYSIVIMSISIISQYLSFPIFVIRYLSRGIFYTSFALLIVLFLFSVFSERKVNSFFKGNLVALVLLCLFPLFYGYIFPFSSNTPFTYGIPLLLLSMIVIANNLIINRMTTFRFHMSITVLYILISLIATIAVVCFIFMVRFIPWWLVAGYSFFTIMNFLPILREIILMNGRAEYTFNGQTMFSAVEMEREEIAIYIHDTIIQDVIYYKKQIESLPKPDLNGMLDTLDDIIFELRELCSNIYPLMIKELGMREAILSIVNKFQKKESVVIKHRIQFENFHFENRINNFILRSIKELINNSILHGKAKCINLSIYEQDQYVVIEVTDDGSFETKNETEEFHFGLNVISEKLVLLGGELKIRKKPTRVSMFIPRR